MSNPILLLPKEIAFAAENAGVVKANLDKITVIALSILAGVYISLGADFYTIIISGNGFAGSVKLPAGIVKLIASMVFSLGLILVVLAGAELFTGNMLMIMATASKKIKVQKMLKMWCIAYVGNFIASVLIAYILFSSGQYKSMNGNIGLTAISIANAKCHLTFSEALIKGFLCNALVCLAVWMTISGKTVTDKILAILFPITGFVAMGFEHCVANMFFIPLGLLIKYSAGNEFLLLVGKTAGDFQNLNLFNFFIGNLVPVTLGNIAGGAIVGIMYWVIYCRSNLMNADNSEESIKQLINVGRRKTVRYPTDGTVLLYSDDGSTIKGKLKDISKNGLLAIFLNKKFQVDPSEKMKFDITTNNDQIKLIGNTGVLKRKKVYNTLCYVAIKFVSVDNDNKKVFYNYLDVLKKIDMKKSMALN
ncbi:Formate/nitrite transporter [Candidatus Magnetomorum sp. HK-1]|nr:Formate/nitrite transporter [Candidatus Magnetomorum sp. HK-1]